MKEDGDADARAGLFEIDLDFEFSAPHFYDFTVQETAEQVHEAESWFETAVSYEASPLSSRTRGLDTGVPSCSHDVDEVEQVIARVSHTHNGNVESPCVSTMDLSMPMDLATHNDNCNVNGASAFPVEICGELVDVNLCTPAKQCYGQGTEKTVGKYPMESPGSLPVKRLYSDVWKKVPQTDGLVGAKTSQNSLVRRIQNMAIKKDKGAVDKTVLQENQAKKKQKLEGGRQRQILNVKERQVPPKTPASVTVPQAFQFCTEKRLAVHKGTECGSISKIGRLASPFVSLAEKVRRFQMKTPDRFHIRPPSHDESVVNPMERPKLKLTRPKEPELETSQRARPARIKSTAELEEEMLLKVPKFKARPVNKKILEGPTLPVMQKSTPQVPEFHEFHLKTMERALQHYGTVSTASMSSNDSATFAELRQRRKSAPNGGISEPREPHLATAARARPTKVKSSEELEQEELANMPKFKARPLDKKIFWSRGDLGIFRNHKREVTTPVEFHFATDERVHHQPQLPLDLLSKLSLNTSTQQENVPPRPTKPDPFHLATEDRGLIKEKRFLTELMENELKDQEARIPKANPLPYTTDYPVVPPKPEPKVRTKPAPFQLESLARHEEEMHRKTEQLLRAQQEEAEKRKFRAQPVLCEGPVFIPERSRKPLTEVQEFSLQVDVRAADRAEFDKKVAEKQNLYKRFREEFEAAKRAEDERAIKSMRRTMIPHARPMPTFEKPFVPQRSSKELTRPRSPRLHVLHRRERRRSLTDRRGSLTFSIQKRCQMR